MAAFYNEAVRYGNAALVSAVYCYCLYNINGQYSRRISIPAMAAYK